MRVFSVSLEGGRRAEIDLPSRRMHESVMRPSLNDPQVKPREAGDHIIVFRVKEAGKDKPLKPDAVLVADINVNKMGNNGLGHIAIALDDGRVVYPTIAIEDLAVGRRLLQEAQANPGANRRLFFARVEGELKLVDTRDVRKPPKAPRPSKPPQTQERPSAAPESQ